jgi:hypothetical protein
MTTNMLGQIKNAKAAGYAIRTEVEALLEVEARLAAAEATIAKQEERITALEKLHAAASKA